MIVQENSGGLVSGTIVEKLGGFGDVLTLYTEKQIPISPVFRSFNFSADVIKSHLIFPYNSFENLMNISIDEIDNVKENSSINLNPKIPIDDVIRIRKRFDQFADSLVIASHHNPAVVLYSLFPFLAPSGKLVIFHPQLQVRFSSF